MADRDHCPRTRYRVCQPNHIDSEPGDPQENQPYSHGHCIEKGIHVSVVADGVLLACRLSVSRTRVSRSVWNRLHRVISFSISKEKLVLDSHSAHRLAGYLQPLSQLLLNPSRAR